MKLTTICLALLVAAALSFISVRADSAMVLKSTGLVADFKQKMPCLMLYPNTNATNITTFDHHKLAQLQEVNNGTAVVSQIALDTKLNWAFGDPYTKRDNNGSVIYTAVNLTAVFSMKNHNVGVHLVWYMYQKETIVKNGNENVTAYANSLKWAVMVEGWPFSEPHNSLQLVLHLAHHNTEKNETHSDFTVAANTSASEPTTVHLPGEDDKELRVDLSNTAIIDGHTGSPVTIAKNDTNVLIRFKHFDHFVAYDPVARITEAEGGGMNWLLYIILGVVAVLVLFIVVIGVAGFAVYKLVLEKRGPRYVPVQ